MVLLGWAVGKGSTGVDDWFHRFRHSPAEWLLFFTDPWVLAPLLTAIVTVALYQRRWRLAVVAGTFPPAAYVLVQLLKRLFGREKGSALAYPSGHTTVMVVVLGMLVLVAGAALWAVLVVGALLLGTAIVCVAAEIARLDRCQPCVRSTSQRELA